MLVSDAILKVRPAYSLIRAGTRIIVQLYKFPLIIARIVEVAWFPIVYTFIDNYFLLFYRKETWSTCPSGYFLNGLYRTNGNNLHNIEEGWCCKPQGHPEWYDGCYYEDISTRFDQKGWSNCSKLGYYVTGVHRDNYDNWLHNIDKLKCCKMWTGK